MYLKVNKKKILKNSHCLFKVNQNNDIDLMIGHAIRTISLYIVQSEKKKMRYVKLFTYILYFALNN